MIKIAHIITGFNQGGAETALYRLISNLTPLTYEITVISLTGPGFYSDKILELNLPIYYLRMNKFNCIAKLFILAGMLKKIKPDIVHTWMYHANLWGGIAAKYAGVKRVIWGIRSHGDKLKFSTPMIMLLAGYLSYWIPSDIVFCSKSAIRSYIDLGYSENKIKYIPNGFDAALFMPGSQAHKKKLCMQYGAPLDKILFGAVAGYRPEKDYPNLLKAFQVVCRHNPQVFLVICGRGLNDQNQMLVQLICDLKLQSHVLMIDGVSQPLDIYQMVDFFVLSSKTEGFPNVMGEAMSCAVPCIVTNVGDAAYLVGNINCVVEKERFDLLAAACQKMLGHSVQELAIMGQQARARIVEQFSLAKIVQQYVDLYEIIYKKGDE